MPDEPDPPRKFYGFKPKEFTAANPHLAPAPSASSRPTPTASTAPSLSANSTTPTSPADSDRIDVHDLNRLAATGLPVLSTQPAPAQENEVHEILRDNLARANAAGLNDVKIDPNYRTPRQRRIQRFFILIPLINLPLGFLAWSVGVKSQFGAIMFVLTISAMAMLTARLIWSTFFLNTD